MSTVPNNNLGGYSARYFARLEEMEVRPVADHAADWLAYLDSRRSTAKHRTQMSRYIASFLAASKVGTWPEITATNVTAWARHDLGDSLATQNRKMRALKMFCRWLHSDNRAPTDALKALRLRTVQDGDRKYVRRSFSFDEFKLLVEAAYTGPCRFGLTGEDRAMLYELAAYTGQRRGSLLTLTRRCLQQLDGVPCIVCDPKLNKSKKRIVVPVRAEFLPRLVNWIELRDPTAPLFRGVAPHWAKTAKMVRFDATAAGIDPDYPAKLDFHALRYTHATLAARAGIDVRVTQTILGHSSVALTQQIYTDAQLADKIRSVNALGSQLLDTQGQYAASADSVSLIKSHAAPAKSATEGSDPVADAVVSLSSLSGEQLARVTAAILALATQKRSPSPH